MNRPAPRLLVETPLSQGISVELPRKKTHYLKHVLRLRIGAEVLIFNGHDGEWLAQIRKLGNKGCTLTAIKRTRDQTSTLSLILVFAPLKKNALDFLIQKSTELGVGAIQPVITERTAVNRINKKRLTTQVHEASEQCGRLEVPKILNPEPLITFLNTWPDNKPLWTGDETGAGHNFSSVLQNWASKRMQLNGQGILIGPEGGFTINELATLRSMPFVTMVDLGPRILRAETAAVAALSCWQTVLGDWRRNGNL
tara:strand:+ start:123 stop:884 length:762 start_codon:yes stop_codon:yes gene_type:complete